LKKIDIQLVIRNTDYNRFQDKMRRGHAQLFQWGWSADYPDPENFLFLLYGPNSKVKFGGENAANYENQQFDHLFEQIRVMKDGEERQRMINEALELLTNDSPWLWGFHPKLISLYHNWNYNIKPNVMANNTLKYRRIDVIERDKLQQSWNKPILWPLGVILILICVMILPAYLMYRRKMNKRIS
jgi:oligopeptide transport system substrate-binding protein